MKDLTSSLLLPEEPPEEPPDEPEPEEAVLDGEGFTDDEVAVVATTELESSLEAGDDVLVACAFAVVRGLQLRRLCTLTTSEPLLTWRADKAPVRDFKRSRLTCVWRRWL